MIQQAVEMVKQAVADGQFLQVHGPSGTHDIDLDEAIEAIEWIESKEVNMKGLTVEGSTIKFGDGTVCITVEDPDDHNADASNHVTGE